MKTKRSGNKRVLILNKRTIVNLSKREMVGVKVGDPGVHEGQDLGDDLVAYTVCSECPQVTLTPVPVEPTTLFGLSLLRDCG
jgi:hypothetical protein